MSEKMTKADLEAQVAEQAERIAELEAQLSASGGPQPDTDPRRDVAEVARELRGES